MVSTQHGRQPACHGTFPGPAPVEEDLAEEMSAHRLTGDLPTLPSKPCLHRAQPQKGHLLQPAAAHLQLVQPHAAMLQSFSTT